uniref:U6 snRNA-associated Sm-like protein LSm8 n=1 Tax=Gallus gallus TaxID=9031 RepID=A0A8V0XBA1_CHICK
ARRRSSTAPLPPASLRRGGWTPRPPSARCTWYSPLAPPRRSPFETQSRRGAARAQWPDRALPAVLQGSCGCAAGGASSEHDGSGAGSSSASGAGSSSASGAGSSSASGAGSSSVSGAGNVAAGVRRSAGDAAMTSALENYINRTVAVITSDGRMIVGTLKGFDQTINLILDESHERVFSSSQGVEQVVLGLYIVRGDNVAVIGEIDEETDSALDLGNIRAEPLNSVVH